jgi:hypothetical protein
MIRGEATATLADGRTLTLAMNMRALADAAALSGIPSSEIFGVLKKDDGRQLKAVFGLIEGSLKKFHRDIGPDEIDELMDTDSEALTDALFKSVAGAFNDDTSEADEGNVPRSGTSTRSKGTGRKRA